MWELSFKVLVQGECHRCRPLMLQSYPRESICDVVWQLFAPLVQDMCCEAIVHAMCELCSRAVVCAVYAWPGMASLFVRGRSPVWTGDTWMGPLA